MSSEPGNESFFCALRPIPRILSLRRRCYAGQVQVRRALAPQNDFGVLTRRMRIAIGVCSCRSTGYVRSQLEQKASERSVRVGKTEVRFRVASLDLSTDG